MKHLEDYINNMKLRGIPVYRLKDDYGIFYNEELLGEIELVKETARDIQCYHSAKLHLYDTNGNEIEFRKCA